MSTKVKVIEPLVYAGPGWQALPKSAEGDIITVATAKYAQELVEAGLVAHAVEEVPAEQPTDGGDGNTDPKADGGNGSEDGQTTADSEPTGDGESVALVPPDGSGSADSGDGSEDSQEPGDSEPNDTKSAEGEGQGLSGLLEKWVADLLVKEGLDTPAKVAAAEDKTLLAISGIGKKTLDDIRKALKGE